MGVLDDSYEEWVASHHEGDEEFPDDPTDPAADQSLWPHPSEPDHHHVADGSRPTGGCPARPIAEIRLDLQLALAYQDRYRQRPAADPWVQTMRDDNEADIARLQAELHAATDVVSRAGPETPGESAAIDDYERTARVAYAKGIPDDGGGGDPPVSLPQSAAGAAEPAEPRWPRRDRGLPGPDVGL